MKYPWSPNQLSTGTLGAIGELRVAADLMQQGYLVGRNLSPNGIADLIAWKPDELLLVEVKSYVTDQVLRAADPRVSLIAPTCSGNFVRKVNLIARQYQIPETE